LSFSVTLTQSFGSDGVLDGITDSFVTGSYTIHTRQELQQFIRALKQAEQHLPGSDKIAVV
jgi:hypothetical protein